MANKNLKNYAVKFSKERQPTKKQVAKRAKKRTETMKKRRELTDLLSLAIKGKFGEEINGVLSDKLGLKANTIEEALHFVQIAKAIGHDDTAAYVALMNTSGLNKPVKVASTDKDGNDVIPFTDSQVDKIIAELSKDEV